MNRFEIIGRRIKDIREHHQETQTELARVLGYTQTAISGYERGHRQISLLDLQHIADHYGVPLNYFLGRETAEDRAATEYKVLTNQVEQLREEVRAIGDSVHLPIFGCIPAGWPDVNEAELLGYEPAPSSEVKSKNAFWLKVRGDSLEDAGIESGDLVLIDPGEEHTNGDIVGLRLETGESVIRRAYKENDGLRLEAANPKFSTIHITEGEVTAYGVATRVQKKLK